MIKFIKAHKYFTAVMVAVSLLAMTSMISGEVDGRVIAKVSSITYDGLFVKRLKCHMAVRVVKGRESRNMTFVMPAELLEDAKIAQARDMLAEVVYHKDPLGPRVIRSFQPHFDE